MTDREKFLTRALLIIEGLTYLGPDNELIGNIYSVAHVATGHCENPHEDWLADMDKYEADLKELQTIDVEETLKKLGML